MEQPSTKRRTARETMLTVTLVVLLGGSIGFFLNLVSLGLFGYVAGAVVIFVAIGYLHYLLWGQAMMQETAGEREEQHLRDRMEQPPDAADAIQDLSHRTRYR
jgi:hypothetical protein